MCQHTSKYGAQKYSSALWMVMKLERCTIPGMLCNGNVTLLFLLALLPHTPLLQWVSCSLVSDLVGKIMPYLKQEFSYWFLWLSLNWLSKDFCVLGRALCADCLLTFFPSKGKPGTLPAPFISGLWFFWIEFYIWSHCNLFPGLWFSSWSRCDWWG